jgi:hypothetical protein
MKDDDLALCRMKSESTNFGSKRNKERMAGFFIIKSEKNIAPNYSIFLHH